MGKTGCFEDLAELKSYQAITFFAVIAIEPIFAAQTIAVIERRYLLQCFKKSKH
jgi:hypothetical protein